MITENLESDNAALLKFNPYMGCYITEVTTSMGDKLKNNLYVLADDPIIDARRNEYNYQFTGLELKDDVFFAKRFTESVLGRLKSLWILSLHEFHIDGYLILFYNSPHGKRLAEETDSDKLAKYLRPLSPALKYYFMEHYSLDIIHQTKELVKELNSVTHHGSREAIILKVELKDIPDAKQSQKLRNALMAILTEEERFIQCSPLQLLILLDKSDPKKIEETISSEVNIATIDQSKFPELGKNLLAYL